MTCTQAAHDAAIADPAQWSAWRFVAYQYDGAVILEYRNCPRCYSTRTKAMRGYAWDPVAQKPVPR